MQLVSELVETLSAEKPFKVIFRQGADVLAEWPVDDEARGNAA